MSPSSLLWCTVIFFSFTAQHLSHVWCIASANPLLRSWSIKVSSKEDILEGERELKIHSMIETILFKSNVQLRRPKWQSRLAILDSKVVNFSTMSLLSSNTTKRSHSCALTMLNSEDMVDMLSWVMQHRLVSLSMKLSTVIDSKPANDTIVFKSHSSIVSDLRTKLWGRREEKLGEKWQFSSWSDLLVDWSWLIASGSVIAENSGQSNVNVTLTGLGEEKNLQKKHKTISNETFISNREPKMTWSSLKTWQNRRSAIYWINSLSSIRYSRLESNENMNFSISWWCWRILIIEWETDALIVTGWTPEIGKWKNWLALNKTGAW